MTSSEMRVLVAGGGSIGRRHLGNLIGLGVASVAVCDPAEATRAAVVERFGGTAHARFEEALAEVRPHVVAVCTPPVLHVEQVRAALLAGAHVFVEKPLAPSAEGLDELIALAAERRRIVQVGYNLRFHRGLKQVKELVQEGRIGRILWSFVQFGQYLPDWRPTVDYRASYTARRALGGGILLDASHEVDYLTWLLGRPREVSCMAGTASRLEVDVEDTATVLLGYPDGVHASVHVDFVQRAYSRSCTLAGEMGTISWDYAKKEVRLYSAERQEWEVFAHDVDPNEMYVEEMKSFLRAVAEETPAAVTLSDGADVVRLIDAAKASARSGARVLV